MSRIFLPVASALAWEELVGSSKFKSGFSARALAHRWHDADGLPAPVRAALDESPYPALHKLTMHFGTPERAVRLHGGTRPSYTDLLVLARNQTGLVALGVEGKAKEDFGPTVAAWRGRDAGPGKEARLQHLCAELDLDPDTVDDLRYQLFHRTVAVIQEARLFGARTAIMLVDAFGPLGKSAGDFTAFVNRLDPQPGPLSAPEAGTWRAAVRICPPSDIELYAA